MRYIGIILVYLKNVSSSSMDLMPIDIKKKKKVTNTKNKMYRYYLLCLSIFVVVVVVDVISTLYWNIDIDTRQACLNRRRDFNVIPITNKCYPLSQILGRMYPLCLNINNTRQCHKCNFRTLLITSTVLRVI